MVSMSNSQCGNAGTFPGRGGSRFAFKLFGRF